MSASRLPVTANTTVDSKRCLILWKMFVVMGDHRCCVVWFISTAQQSLWMCWYICGLTLRCDCLSVSVREPLPNYAFLSVWGNLYQIKSFQLSSDRAKANAKAKIFFGFCRLVFDLFSLSVVWMGLLMEVMERGGGGIEIQIYWNGIFSW